MSQTSYAMTPAAALPGMIADPLDARNTIVSRINAAALPAGVFVTRDAADDAVKVPVSTGEVTASGVGFTILSVGKEPVSDGSSVDWPATKGVSVMTFGKLWVTCESAAAYGGDVFVRFTVEAPDLQLGSVRNDADTDKAVAAPGWKFRSTLAAAGLVLIER